MNDYSAPCPDCAIEMPSDAEIERYLDEYARALKDNVRAPYDEYISRLSICAACEHKRAFTCALCGCYIKARAAKAAMRCPLPRAPKWREADCVK